MSKPYIDKYLSEEKHNKKDYNLYMKMDFETIFQDFDPNATGFIEVEQMRPFLKTVAHD